jgi:hypothetical protein
LVESWRDQCAKCFAGEEIFKLFKRTAFIQLGYTHLHIKLMLIRFNFYLFIKNKSQSIPEILSLMLLENKTAFLKKRKIMTCFLKTPICTNDGSFLLLLSSYLRFLSPNQSNIHSTAFIENLLCTTLFSKCWGQSSKQNSYPPAFPVSSELMDYKSTNPAPALQKHKAR